jgi:hypothetical protein
MYLHNLHLYILYIPILADKKLKKIYMPYHSDQWIIFQKNIIKVTCIIGTWYGELQSLFPRK